MAVSFWIVKALLLFVSEIWQRYAVMQQQNSPIRYGYERL